MKIAQFKSIDCGYTTVYDERLAKHMTGVVQLSEFVDVEFPPLATEEVVKAQLGALDSAELELRNKFEQKLGQINNERAKLRSITYDGAS